MRRLSLLVGVVIAIGVLLAPRAIAHAYLVGTDPTAGAALRSPAIALHFSEGADANLSTLDVVDAGGRRWPVTPLAHPGRDQTVLVGTVPAGVADGPADLEWKSVATDDGHVLSGTFGVKIALPVPLAATSTVAAPPPIAADAGVSSLFSVVRLLSYLAMALLCGGLAFLAMVWPAGADVRRSRLVLWVSWAVGLIATGLGIALEGASVSQRGLASLFDRAQLGTTLSGHYGTVWAVRALLYLLAVPVLLQLRREGARVVRTAPWLVAASAVGVALLRTPGLVAHTAEGSWAWLGGIADLTHLIGVALWIGGLGFLCLVVLPRRRPDELQQIIPAFSMVALGAVVAIVIAGVFMSWQLVGSVHAFTASHFGRVLLLKLGILAAVLVAASLSRRWVQGQLTFAVVTGGASEVVRPFVYSVLAESALAVGVLAVASVLVNTNPPH